jgi:hypothetical protein
MDFAGLLGSAWNKFVAELVPLVVFTLVGILLSMTIILIPTVLGGWARCAIAYLRDGQVPEVSELWNFDDYLPILLLLILFSFGVTIGYSLLIVPGLILNVWWLYSLFFLLDRNMGVVEAFGASKQAVSRGGFVNHFIVLVIVSAASVVGGTLWLGVLFTTPFAVLFLAVVYLDSLGEGTASFDSGSGSGTP